MLDFKLRVRASRRKFVVIWFRTDCRLRRMTLWPVTAFLSEKSRPRAMKLLSETKSEAIPPRSGTLTEGRRV